MSFNEVLHRVKELKDGRKVVLATRVHEFLTWASKLFDISVCSLGDQQYVDMVVQLLNSESPIVRSGSVYSARGEYLHIAQVNSKKTPKDLNSLYAFYALKDTMNVPIEPLILDDHPGIWPLEQQDNVIIIKEIINSFVWDVSFFPVVQPLLAYIHDNYFRALDAWAISNDPKGPPPSTLTYYKEFLRKELSNLIAEKLA
jgi:hypothetical protein